MSGHFPESTSFERLVTPRLLWAAAVEQTLRLLPARVRLLKEPGGLLEEASPWQRGE